MIIVIISVADKIAATNHKQFCLQTHTGNASKYLEEGKD